MKTTRNKQAGTSAPYNTTAPITTQAMPGTSTQPATKKINTAQNER